MEEDPKGELQKKIRILEKKLADGISRTTGYRFVIYTPKGYSVIVALTGLPIGYSVIVALTGLPIGYSVIVALTGLL